MDAAIDGSTRQDSGPQDTDAAGGDPDAGRDGAADPDGSMQARCEGNDPTGAEGRPAIAGCPCTRVPDSLVCCPGHEDNVQCEDGTWHLYLDGCNLPPCPSDEDGGLDDDGGTDCVRVTLPTASQCHAR